jgi:hypothetical protein
VVDSDFILIYLVGLTISAVVAVVDGGSPLRRRIAISFIWPLALAIYVFLGLIDVIRFRKE